MSKKKKKKKKNYKKKKKKRQIIKETMSIFDNVKVKKVENSCHTSLDMTYSSEVVSRSILSIPTVFQRPDILHMLQKLQIFFPHAFEVYPWAKFFLFFQR